MTAAETACMLVNLGYDDDNVTKALVLGYHAITHDEARQLVAEAHRTKAGVEAEMDAAIEVEREAPRASEGTAD